MGEVNSTWLLALLIDFEVFTWREVVNAALEREPETMRRLKEKENQGGRSLAGEFQDLLALNLIELVDPFGPSPLDPDYTPREFRLSDSGREAARDYIKVATN